MGFFSSKDTFSSQKILLEISDACDGLRCDMAILPLQDVFEKHMAYAHYPTGRINRDD